MVGRAVLARYRQYQATRQDPSRYLRSGGLKRSATFGVVATPLPRKQKPRQSCSRRPWTTILAFKPTKQGVLLMTNGTGPASSGPARPISRAKWAPSICYRCWWLPDPGAPGRLRGRTKHGQGRPCYGKRAGQQAGRPKRPLQGGCSKARAGTPAFRLRSGPGARGTALQGARHASKGGRGSISLTVPSKGRRTANPTGQLRR
jgi:hypothetical protein